MVSRLSPPRGAPVKYSPKLLPIAAIFAFVLFGGAVQLSSQRAEAVELELTSGGVIKGKLLNPEQKPRREYTLETPTGVVVRFHQEQVKQVLPASEREQQYAELLARMPETAMGHWQMSQWCQKNYMKEERQRHLEACIELAPDHEQARRALGFTLQEGEWLLSDVLNRQMGLLRHGMRWKLPAEIALEKMAEEHELAEKALAQQLRLWQTWFVRGKNVPEARRRFLALRDPLAVSTLGTMLEEAESKEFKRILIRSIRNIGAESGSLPLINEAMRTRDDVLLSDCFDALREIGPDRASVAFTAKLQSKTPSAINRAAAGIAAMGAQEAVPDLIDVLVTRHKIRISSGSQGSINPTFSSNGGGGGLSMGGGPKEVEKAFKNQTVLDALATMTGVNFGFNVDAWKTWLIQQTQPASSQLRRGS